MELLKEPIYVYALIFFVKIIEVTLATTRIVLITKGERLKGAAIGLVEVTIWALLVAKVLSGLTEDPLKLFVYALGFSIGNYVGSMFEEKLGYGTVRVEVIVKQEDGSDLVDSLRREGFAVTVLEGEGMNFKRNVLVMHIKRKKSPKAIEIIKKLQHNAVITVNEVKPVYGGYGLLKK